MTLNDFTVAKMMELLADAQLTHEVTTALNDIAFYMHWSSVKDAADILIEEPGQNIITITVRALKFLQLQEDQNKIITIIGRDERNNHVRYLYLPEDKIIIEQTNKPISRITEITSYNKYFVDTIDIQSTYDISVYDLLPIME